MWVQYVGMGVQYVGVGVGIGAICGAQQGPRYSPRKEHMQQ